jgi:hypothetical protein
MFVCLNVSSLHLKGVLSNTGHTQKNGAVSKVNSLLIPHHSFVYALYKISLLKPSGYFLHPQV